MHMGQSREFFFASKMLPTLTQKFLKSCLIFYIKSITENYYPKMLLKNFSIAKKFFLNHPKLE